MAKKKLAKNPEALNFLKEKDLRKLLELGKSRGVLTFDEVNDLIPTEVVEAQKIDLIMDFLSESEIEVDDTVRLKADDDDGTDTDGDIDSDLPIAPTAAKKKKAMHNWYMASFKLLIRSGLKKKDIIKAVKSENGQLPLWFFYSACQTSH